MSRIVTTERPVQIGFMHLEENGIIGFHQAVVSQLLLIINGEGWVRGNEASGIKLQLNAYFIALK